MVQNNLGDQSDWKTWMNMKMLENLKELIGAQWLNSLETVSGIKINFIQIIKRILQVMIFSVKEEINNFSMPNLVNQTNKLFVLIVGKQDICQDYEKKKSEPSQRYKI